MSNIGGVLKQSSFLMMGQLYFMVMSIVLAMMMTRLLSVEDFGRYVYAQSIILMLSVLGSLGLHGAITQFTAHHWGKGEISQVKGVLFGLGKDILLLSSLLAVVVFFVGYRYGDQLLNKEGVGILVAILALTYPLRAVMTIVKSFFLGISMMRITAILQYASEPTLRLFLLAILLLGSLSSIDYWIGGLVIIFFLNALFSLYIYRRYAPDSIHHSVIGKVDRKTAYDYALPLVFLHFSTIAYANLDVSMLGNLGSVEDAGIYRIYKLMVGSMNGVIYAVAMAYYPVITGLIAQGSTGDLEGLYEDVSRWMLYLGLGGFLFMLLYGALVGGWLFGEAYRISEYNILLMLGASVLIYASMGPNSVSLMAYGYTRALAFISILALISLGVIGIVLIPDYGMAGAALAFMTSQLVIQGIGALVLYRKQKLSPFNKKSVLLLLIGISVAALALLAVAPGYHHYQYAIQGVVLSFIALAGFVFLLIFLSLIPPQDTAMVMKFFQRLVSRVRKGEKA